MLNFSEACHCTLDVAFVEREQMEEEGNEVQVKEERRSSPQKTKPFSGHRLIQLAANAHWHVLCGCL